MREIKLFSFLRTLFSFFLLKMSQRALFMKKINLKTLLLTLKLFVITLLLNSPSLLIAKESSRSQSRIIKRTNDEVSKTSITYDNLDKIKKTTPETFKTGVFISNIHDIKHADQEFKAIFWIWFLHSNKFENPLELFEIKNSKSFHFFNDDHIPLSDGRILSIAKVEATISKNWQLSNYPFDADKLEIRIEVSGYGGDTIQYIPDCEDSVLDTENLKESLSGWYVEKFDLHHVFKTYPTNFGNPEASYDNFSRVIPTIYVKREWFPEFIKYFTILYLSIFFTSMAIIVRRKNTESKVNLIAISIASIIVSRFIVSATLPPSTGISLYSTIEYYTFLFIVVTTFVMLAPDFFDRLSFMLTKKFREIYLASSLCIYLVINIVFISIAYYEYIHVFDDIKLVCYDDFKKPILTDEIKNIIKKKTH
tara:strand:- start:1965 stop:3230 length:1266 start_codon:yes stop_codon:yes gene_type:complete